MNVSPRAFELYRRLVVDGPAPAAGPCAEELAAAGLVTRSPCHPGEVVAVPPDVVGSTLVESFASALAARHAAVRAALGDVVARQDEWPRVEVITDPHEIKRAAVEVLASARVEGCEFALATHDPSLTSVDFPVRLDTGPGVRYRVVYASSCLSSTLGRQIIDHSRALGEEQRVFAGSLVSLRVSDAAGLVRVDGAALHVSSPPLVALLRTWFDLVWDRSSRIHEANPLTARERAVLELQAAGHKDAAIARALALNVRTVRRHVATIIAALGVDSRFAAGVEAARRGWLPLRSAEPPGR